MVGKCADKILSNTRLLSSEDTDTLMLKQMLYSPLSLSSPIFRPKEVLELDISVFKSKIYLLIGLSPGGSTSSQLIQIHPLAFSGYIYFILFLFFFFYVQDQVLIFLYRFQRHNLCVQLKHLTNIRYQSAQDLLLIKYDCAYHLAFQIKVYSSGDK